MLHVAASDTGIWIEEWEAFLDEIVIEDLIFRKYKKISLCPFHRLVYKHYFYGLSSHQETQMCLHFLMQPLFAEKKS